MAFEVHGAQGRGGYLHGQASPLQRSRRFSRQRRHAGWRSFPSAARAAGLARAYLRAVTDLMAGWRETLRGGRAPRSDAAAWAVIDVLPAHPIITAPVAQAATGRAKAAVHNAIEQLVEVGVLEPLSNRKRNRSYEAVGLLELLERLEEGRPPYRAGISEGRDRT